MFDLHESDAKPSPLDLDSRSDFVNRKLPEIQHVTQPPNETRMLTSSDTSPDQGKNDENLHLPQS